MLHVPMLTLRCKQLKYLKLVFEVTKNIQNSTEWPFTTNPNFVCNIYKAVCLVNRITVDILMLHRGYRMNFDRLH